MAITQKHRPFAVNTSLGEDVLVFYHMTATEQLGRLFEFDLELLSERTDIQPKDVLGKKMTVRMELPEAHGGEPRYFNGFVTRFSYLGMRGMRHGVYRATLSPWLWFLDRTADCRIFQNQSVPDIIKKVFEEYGIAEFKKELSGQYRTWEYCVQYRETDFNFVSRLMEQEGIYYYFKHEDDKHTMILSDAYSSHSQYPGYADVPYYPSDNMSYRKPDHIHEWILETQVQAGAYALTDFDFKVPRKNLYKRLSNPKSHAQSDFEVYDYPGKYIELGDGNTYLKIRLEELLAQHEVFQGQGVARGLAAGYLFNLSNCGREDHNREYLIVSATHQLQADSYESVPNPEMDKPYQGHITAIDAQQPYRAPRITRKPIVQGPQTAVVVGKDGEEIWTDQYGRVKVQFHWDREGKNNENSSCWIRVSHPWAGKNWGAVAIPRIGQEVVVDFLEGDPDQPLITGRVYNGASMPPYGLPDKAVISGVKSNSTKGGGGYNEYVFDDTKGNELIREHGQYDKDSTIEHDLREHVLNNRSRDVTVNETISIGSNRSKSVGKNETTSIGDNRSENVGKNETISIGKNRTEDVGENETISIGKNRTTDIGQNESRTVGKDETIEIGQHRKDKIAKNVTVEIGEKRQTQVGKDDLMQVGKKFYLEAGDEITLKTGSASFTMKKDGTIQIKGKDITITGSGKIGIKASGDLVLKGSKIAEN